MKNAALASTKINCVDLFSHILSPVGHKSSLINVINLVVHFLLLVYVPGDSFILGNAFLLVVAVT